MERSPSPRQRPSSPDVVCPICLGEITNKAVTDSCLHSFCFSCLSEWSKVKPECPLCKQKFSIIYHTIKSMGDYQEYRIDAPLDLARAPHGLVAGIDPFDPHIFINVAVQRATRFGYRFVFIIMKFVATYGCLYRGYFIFIHYLGVILTAQWKDYLLLTCIHYYNASKNNNINIILSS
uniref:E3 ubiquitin-protein ligase Topors n=1 Tax=Lygus hesperus TaxID=30085 RepID=A0A0A9YPP8_LYGHE